MKHLDGLLRGQKTSHEQLAGGRVDLPMRIFVPVGIILGAVYGFFMGWYAGLDPAREAGTQQWIASTLKLPMLFFLTLAVTAPSLYVFSALAGSRVGLLSTLRLLTAAVVVNVTVAASLGPILGFFTLSTESYPFMVLLNIALLAISGFVALSFLMRMLRRMVIPQPPTEDESADARPPSDPARAVFGVWVILYGLVGAQMGWLLRPFIGCPDVEFTWFRGRSGNFFESLLGSLRALLD
jgi:hypothetical protein